MKELCELPEDLSAFEAWLYDRVGGEISGSDVETLKREMEVIQEKEVINPFYPKPEKVKFVALKKTCIAPDKAFLVYNHIYLVYQDANGNERVIRPGC